MQRLLKTKIFEKKKKETISKFSVFFLEWVQVYRNIVQNVGHARDRHPCSSSVSPTGNILHQCVASATIGEPRPVHHRWEARPMVGLGVTLGVQLWALGQRTMPRYTHYSIPQGLSLGPEDPLCYVCCSLAGPEPLASTGGFTRAWFSLSQNALQVGSFAPCLLSS